MDKNKGGGTNTPPDESAVVKAAAWAWYHHGSGSEGGNSAREYDVAMMARHVPRPSRYKQEATKLRGNVDHDVSSKPTVECLSLFDSYELRRISMQLDSLMDCSNDEESFSDNDSVISSSSRNKKKMNLKKVIRGFWVRHAVAVCSTGEDQVVDLNKRPGYRHRPSRPVTRMHASSNKSPLEL
ncbi:hypothetical protein CsatB_000526 [Cannabis sativa]